MPLQQNNNSNHQQVVDTSNNIMNKKTEKCSVNIVRHQAPIKQDDDEYSGPIIVQPVPRRYVILFIFLLSTLINGFQWIYYSNIQDIATKFYNVNSITFTWTSTIFMLAFVLFNLPASVMFEELGLRRSVLVGAFGTAIGACVKCFSNKPDLFFVLLIGQTIVAFSQLFLLSVPPRLASVWFPDNAVTQATALGVFANQFGIALGFAIPPLIVKDNVSRVEDVIDNFDILNLGTAISSIVIFIAVLAMFENEPQYPPGFARLEQIKKEAEKRKRLAGQMFLTRVLDMLKSMKLLLSDKSFVLCLLSYGVFVGTSYAPITLLNQMLEPLYAKKTFTNSSPSYIKSPDDDVLYMQQQQQQQTLLLSTNSASEASGILGLEIMVSGMIGALIWASVLDATHKYKRIVVALQLVGSILMIIFAFSFYYLPLLHMIGCGLGFFVTGYIAIGFEVAVEICYPKPELLVTNMMNLSTQIFGFIITVVASIVNDSFTNVVACIFLAICFSLGLLITLFTKIEKRRQGAIAKQLCKGISPTSSQIISSAASSSLSTQQQLVM